MMDLIQNFDEYFNKIEESINSPKEIKWSFNNNQYIGFFNVDDSDYRIEYLKQVGNNWSFSFSYFDVKMNEWSYDISHKGSGGYSVLSTIKLWFNTMYEKTNPNSIIFSAIDSSDTRKRLYKFFCEKFCQKNNWKFTSRGNDELHLFVMFDDSISNSDKEEVMISVKKVVEIGK